MALISDNNLEPTTTAVVTIRIPCGGDRDLVTDAKERLSRAENIDAITVDELHGIEPKLSATTITVDVTLHSSTTMTEAEVKRRLAEVPALESIESIR